MKRNLYQTFQQSSLLFLLLFLFSFCINTNAQIITTFAGTGTAGWFGDGGQATASKLYNPNGVLSDGAGNIYISDALNQRIRKVNTSGIITEIAGNGTAGFFGDGGPASAAEIHQPSGLALDASGNLYIGDLLNHVVRKVNLSGTITTIAGTPTVSGYFGDGGLATNARLYNPYGLTFDSHGDLYIADQYNHVIRKITMSTGIISTICGNGTSAFSGDGGPASAAKLSFPNAIYMDIYDNLYLSDNGNQRVRMINTSKIINTIAGGGLSTANGVPATNEKLYFPAGMKLDKIGNLYFTSPDNTLRKVNTAGIINIYAGTGTAGFAGDGGLATAALLDHPNDVAIDLSGNIFIADIYNNRIREIRSGNTPPDFTGGHKQTLTVCENSSATSINSLLAITDPDIGQTETWVLFKPAVHGTAVTGYSATSTGTVITPIGLTYKPTPGYSGPDSFQVKVDDGISIDITTIHVTIIPTLVDVIVCPSSVCVTYSVTATDDTLGGVWSISNSHAVINGTTGVVTGVSPGPDTISYSVTNACGTTTVTTTINVNPLPSSITGVPRVCVGGTTTLSDATSGGTWISGNLGVASIGTSGVVTGVSAGNATDTFKIISTGCYATISVTVNPTPGPVTGTATVCAGSTTPLSDASSGGVWTSSITPVATVGTGGIVTGVSLGTSIISYSYATGCAATQVVTVYPIPADLTPIGPQTICLGNTINLSDASPGGVWTSTISSVATVGTSGVVTGVGVGTSAISYTNANGCAKAKVITVANSPVPIVPPSATVCVGYTFAFSDATAGGVWSSINNLIATAGTSGVVTGAGPGTDTIFYTIGGCSVGASVTVTALPNAGSITGVPSLCVGALATLSDGAAGGVWSSTNTTVATVGGTGIIAGGSAGTTTISYTVSGPFCASVATNVVTVNPLPSAGVITGPSVVCVGASITLSDIVTGGVWSSSNSVVAVSGSVVVTGITPGTCTISYIVTNVCGSDTATKTITVMQLPDAGVITGPQGVCAGASITLSDTVSGGVWSSSNTIVAVSGNSVTGITAGACTISYTVTNSCGSNTATKAITVNPLPDAGTITGLSGVCKGAIFQLSETVPGGKWSSSNVSIAGIDSVSGMANAMSAGTAIITYTTAPSAYGCINSTTFPLAVSGMLIAGNISQVTCYGSNNGSIVTSISGGSGPYQYTWSKGETSSVINNLPSGSYTLQVKDISTQCVATDSFIITQPDSLLVTSFAKNDTCKGGNGSISVSVSGGTAPYQYLWSNNMTTGSLIKVPAGSYTLVVADKNNCKKNLSVIVEEDSCVDIIIHDVITPNGDGINDVWAIEGIRDYPKNTVQIFDKWGTMLFEKNGYNNDWGGSGSKGELLPDGTYFYLVKLNATIGKNVFTGAVLIKR